jgi:hypothetical protein
MTSEGPMTNRATCPSSSGCVLSFGFSLVLDPWPFVLPPISLQ